MALDIEKITSSELKTSRIDQLISNRESFQIVGVASMSTVVSEIEGRIEKSGLKCRVYTEYRGAAIAGSMWNPTAVLGVAAAIGMAAHNLATLNPDYEIGKNKVAGTVTVTYKK